MKRYVNKMISLEDKAVGQVAINLCQENGFKEIALNLEKPTFGGFLYNVLDLEPAFFVSDPETLSIWTKVKEDERLCKAFQNSPRKEGGQRLKQWHAAVEVQCERLAMHLPDRFKPKIRPWINRIALEYLTYARRQEAFFEVSRYYLMNTLTVEDWDGEGQVDQEKVARRLLEDERLTVLQRYKIACVYCLEEQVLPLWNRLTQVDKEFFVKDVNADAFGDCHNFVFLWSRFMDGTIGEHQLWNSALSEAIHCGNLSALMVCWEKLKDSMHQQMVIDRAIECLNYLRRWVYYYSKAFLVSPLVPGTAKYLKRSILPSYYHKLVFFLSQMDQEQQLKFFTYTWETHCAGDSVKFLLDWPYQDNILPTINRLWGIMPHEEYIQCLLSLATKYAEGGGKEGEANNYDYRSLLGALWEDTPEEYKHSVFRVSWHDYVVKYESRSLLPLLLRKSPFEEEDQVLFMRIFCDSPDKRQWIPFDDRLFMCSRLIEEGQWSLLNWFVKESMPQEKIACFKKKFIQSWRVRKLCLDAFEENNVKLMNDVFDWSLESVAEKAEYKNDFLKCKMGLNYIASLLRSGKFAEVESLLDFFSSAVERNRRHKLRFAQKACRALLQDYTDDSWVEDSTWEQMDRIIAWIIDAEEETREFKKDLLYRKGMKTHYTIVFIRRVWEKAERFYQWFGLSSEEIKQLKWNTVWYRKTISLYGSKGLLSLLPSLRWCLADEKTVINFRKVFEEYATFLEEKEQLDELVRKLLDGFRKVPNKTSRKGVSVRYEKGKRGRSSVAVEDEPYSLRKRPK